jgi:hypothetical protein
MWISKNNKFTGYVICLVALFSCLTDAEAVDLFLPALKVSKDNPFTIPLMIDRVDNLAGAKIIVTYDPTLLLFKEGSKTPKSQPMMHIINDRKPGRLVIVMASARGIGGKDFPLIQLTFQAVKKEAAAREVKIDIVEAQLMSDQLKDIPCHVKAGIIKIE